MPKKQTNYLLIKALGVLLLLVLTACKHTSSPSSWIYYKIKVKNGDTINSLAEKYKTHRLNIVKANPNIVKTGLRIGATITIPIHRSQRTVASESSGGLLYGRSADNRSAKVVLRVPVRGDITSPFGMRNGRPHHGIDIGARTGTDIAAAATGKVEFAGWQRGYGRTVILSHRGGAFKTLYAHLSKIRVSKGASIAAGQQIGDVGASGRATGPHLHFELRDKRDIPVNPIKYLPVKPKKKKSFLFGSL